MKSAATRIAHYNNRMLSSLVDPSLAAVNVAAKANYAEHTIAYVAFQEAAHNYLDGQGCLPAEYFNYNAFMGEIWHVDQHFSGAAAVAAGGDLVIKFVGCGCTGVRLRAIAALLGIVIP